jgi:mono/diheme cytochrome c family protein
VLRWVLVAAAALAILLPGAAALVVRFGFPAVSAAPDLTVDRSAEAVERGRYLFHHAARCASCHSPRDWTRYSAPVEDAGVGAGGEVVSVGETAAVASNVTPFALGEWSDGEILRAIACGVSRDGRPLSPLMPYLTYNRMPDRDLEAIVAYLRTLPAIESRPAPLRRDLPERVALRFVPKDRAPRPPEEDPVGRGEYLAEIAGCRSCHTPMHRGRPMDEWSFAGGRTFPYPGGSVVSANITPDENEGIGFYGEDDFVELFRAYGSESARKMPLRGGRNTVMPWTDFSGLTEDDLRALWKYLRTVPARPGSEPPPASVDE